MAIQKIPLHEVGLRADSLDCFSADWRIAMTECTSSLVFILLSEQGSGNLCGAADEVRRPGA